MPTPPGGGTPGGGSPGGGSGSLGQSISGHSVSGKGRNRVKHGGTLDGPGGNGRMNVSAGAVVNPIPKGVPEINALGDVMVKEFHVPTKQVKM